MLSLIELLSFVFRDPSQIIAGIAVIVVYSMSTVVFVKDVKTRKKLIEKVRKLKEVLKKEHNEEIVLRLTNNNISRNEVNEIMNKLSGIKSKEISNLLSKLETTDLLTIKGTVTKIEKVNKESSQTVKNIIIMIVGTVFMTFLSNIFTNIAIKEIKVGMPFFENTVKSINLLIVIIFISLVIALTVIMMYFLGLFKKNNKLDSIHLILINLIDYEIESRKEMEKARFNFYNKTLNSKLSMEDNKEELVKE